MTIAPTTLQFTHEEVAAKYPAFFKRYQIPVEQTAIGSVFKDFFENSKKGLREFFPFDGEGRALVASYEDPREAAMAALSDTLNVLCGLAINALIPTAELNTSRAAVKEIIVDNKLPSGQKFSRWILSKVSNEDATPHLRGYTDLCVELPRLPLAKRYDLDAVVQTFYSELAEIRRMQMHMYLSVNPYDIANASTGKVHSCNSIGGVYEAAPISAAASQHMAILRLESGTGNLLGRCYISFSPDMKSFVVQPVYGYMKNSFVDDAKVWLAAVIDSRLGTPSEWQRYTGNLDIPSEYTHQEPTAIFYTDPGSSCMFRTDFSSLPSIRVAGCRCLLCGAKSSNLVCRMCNNTRVHLCRQCRISFIPKASKMCSTCEKNQKVCPICGELHTRHSEFCVDCSLIHTVCIVCGDTINVHRGVECDVNKITPLLGGMLHAHRTCTDGTKKCPQCGRKMHPNTYRSVCLFCTEHSVTKDSISQAVRYGRDARKRIIRGATPQIMAMNKNIILPQDFTATGYALAA